MTKQVMKSHLRMTKSTKISISLCLLKFDFSSRCIFIRKQQLLEFTLHPCITLVFSITCSCLEMYTPYLENNGNTSFLRCTTKYEQSKLSWSAQNTVLVNTAVKWHIPSSVVCKLKPYRQKRQLHHQQLWTKQTSHCWLSLQYHLPQPY